MADSEVSRTILIRPSEPTAVRQRNRAWAALRRDRAALFGGMVVLIIMLASLAAPLLAPYNPDYQHADGLTELGAPLAPSVRFWLGTDLMGRDLLSRLLYGGRISLVVGLSASFLAISTGMMVGAVAGYAGGLLEQLLMRIVDTVLSFPSMLLMIALSIILPKGVWVVVAVIALFSWAYPARVFYSQTLSIKQRDFVEAARALGAPSWRILFRHILPQLLPLFIVYYSLAVPSTILAEAGLSFLGLGVQPPTASWGQIILIGSKTYRVAPWIFFYPGLAIMLAVVGFNLLGDGLRDALDPRQRR